jgi:DNA primase
MAIADEDVVAVRAASDIVGIVTQYLQLRRVGQRWVGLCPFHNEKSPSFSVNAQENLFYCFGCQASGDVITFVRDVEKLDFVGAVEWLAGRAGVTLHYTDRNEGESRKRRDQLTEVMGRAVEWYHERLLTAPDAGAARGYLRSRGLAGDVVRDYKVGWAPDTWDELCKGLKVGEKALQETGLGFRNSRNRLQDTFRARVMFPIFDAQGRPVSFGGRLLPGADDPHNRGKYKNTPETSLYHKSSVLYGMDRAKKAMVSSGAAVVCEGYTDVIAFQRNGVGAAVATCGTALTDEHVKLLQRYAKRLVVAFDADGAGQAAAERFYQWERQHGLEIVVADLPAGQDPADVARSDPDSLAPAVENATPFMRFRLDRVFEAADLTSPEGRARVAEAAVELVAEHPEALVRDQYLMDVAGRCRMDAERLRPHLDKAVSRQRSGGGRSAGQAASKTADRKPERKRSSQEPPHPAEQASRSDRSDQSDPSYVPHPADTVAVPNAADTGAGASDRGRRRNGRSGAGSDGPAWEVLRHAVHNPGDVGPWLGLEIFADPLHRRILQSLIDATSIPDAIELAAASPEPEASGLLRRLSVEQPESAPFDAVCRHLAMLARGALDELTYEVATIDDPTEALNGSAFLSRCINDLRGNSAEDQRTRGAAESLLAWLRQRHGDGG